VRREIRAFGGNPRRITVDGNSGGGTATLYLAASPAVPQIAFQQVIVSSAVPRIWSNLNKAQSLAVLEHFNVDE
jgi:carboxylesterase type B